MQRPDPGQINLRDLPKNRDMIYTQLHQEIHANAQAVLYHFLSMPLWRSCEIFEEFRALDGHSHYRENPENLKERFYYREGTRPDKVVLIAHADTFFDESYVARRIRHTLKTENGIISGTDSAIGADDRAGVAILWLLRNSGHSLLITDGEEQGLLGSGWLWGKHRDILERLNSHHFMVQLDRKNGHDFTCYRVGTPEFKQFIQESTGFSEPLNAGNSDISVLCGSIPGVNLSTGYYNPHTSEEYLVYSKWYHSLLTVARMLSADLPSFNLHHEAFRLT